MKYKAFFNVTTVSLMPGHFVDDEMWLEFKAIDLEMASHIAFAEFVRHFLVEAQPMPVCTKIELARIEYRGGVKSFLKEGSDE